MRVDRLFRKPSILAGIAREPADLVFYGRLVRLNIRDPKQVSMKSDRIEPLRRSLLCHRFDLVKAAEPTINIDQVNVRSETTRLQTQPVLYVVGRFLEFTQFPVQTSANQPSTTAARVRLYEKLKAIGRFVQF